VLKRRRTEKCNEGTNVNEVVPTINVRRTCMA